MLNKFILIFTILPCILFCTHCSNKHTLIFTENVIYNKHKVNDLNSYQFINEIEENTWDYLYKNKDNIISNNIINLKNNYNFVKKISLGAKFNIYNLPTNIIVNNNILYAINSTNYLIKIDLSNYKIIEKNKLNFLKSDNVVGIAYNNDYLYITTTNGKLYSCSNNGEEKWSINLLYPIQSAPIIDNDKIFVVANNSIYALNTFSGETVWEHKGIENGITLNQAIIPTIYHNFIIVGLSNGKVLLLRKENGQIVWIYSLTKGMSLISNAIIAPPILLNNGTNVLISSINTKTYLLNPIQNTEIWHNLNLGYINLPAIVGNHLFIIDTNNCLTNLDLQDGKTFWSLNLQSLSKKLSFLNWFGPIIVNNNIMIYNSIGEVYFISPQYGNIISYYKLNLSWLDRLTNIFAIVNKTIILLGLKNIYIIK